MADSTNTPQGLTPAQLNYSETSQWKQIIKQALMDTRCASVAFLAEDLDTTKQTVTVQIAIQERVRTQSGAQWWDVPPIILVPVVLPRGGGFSCTLPLKKGDSGLLVFCDTCFDTWWKNGTSGAPKAQNLADNVPASGSQKQFEVRRHYVHDCGFIPGMWSQQDLLSDYSSDSMQLRSDDGQTFVDIAPSSIELKSAAVTIGNGGTALPLVNDNFYQWFVTEVLPYLRSLTPPFTGPNPPTNSETTILKGQ